MQHLRLSVLFSIVVLLLSSIVVTAGENGPIIIEPLQPFEETIVFGCSSTTVTTESSLVNFGNSLPERVLATLSTEQQFNLQSDSVEGPLIIFIGGMDISIDVNNGAYTNTESFGGLDNSHTFNYPEQTGMVPITVTIELTFGDQTNRQLSPSLMNVIDPVEGLRSTSIFTYNAVLDCDNGGVESKCPDNRLNANQCEPIAIYASRDADGSYFITVYQSAPVEAVGTFLFELTSDEIAAASAGDMLDSSAFAKAYIDASGNNIVFEAGPDFEGKIFYFTFPLSSFPSALPLLSTNY